jgi:hypothetical protein
VFFENRRIVLSLAKEAIGSLLTVKKRMEVKDAKSAVITPLRRKYYALTMSDVRIARLLFK